MYFFYYTPYKPNFVLDNKHQIRLQLLNSFVIVIVQIIQLLLDKLFENSVFQAM